MTTLLFTAISQKALPFVIIKSPERDLEHILSQPASPGTVVRIARGQRCPDVPRFFQEVAAAWQFPYYFGENWDALEECLNDLQWIPASRYIFAVTNTDRLFIRDGNNQLARMFEALNQVATGQSMKFQVWLHISPTTTIPGQLAALTDIYSIETIVINSLDQGS